MTKRQGWARITKARWAVLGGLAAGSRLMRTATRSGRWTYWERRD